MPANNRQISPVLDSSLEVKDEVATHPSRLKPVLTKLNNILAETGPLPREVLLLGVASDGLPVLLNLHDPIPGPLLIVGETGAGKTTFLKSLARTLPRTHHADDLQFGVVTDHPDEWNTVENTSHRVGIFPTNSSSAKDLILSLSVWAHENRGTRQSVLLLVDDLESIAKMEPESLQYFRWLLARGPSRRVWVIIAMNADRYGQVISWIPIFRTRIFGRITNGRVAGMLGGNAVSALNKLDAPNQFSLRENDSWIRFRLPG